MDKFGIDKNPKIFTLVCWADGSSLKCLLLGLQRVLLDNIPLRENIYKNCKPIYNVMARFGCMYTFKGACVSAGHRMLSYVDVTFNPNLF